MSVAVIGPDSFTTCFQLIGAEGFDAGSGEAVAETLGRLVDEGRFQLIIIPERFAEVTRLFRERVMSRGEITPVFALIPDFTMETGMRMEELQAVVSLAIGTRLEL
ncbi:MAG: V-type ATP synthase subunit F [Candidatus Bathyarchaeota archaeon]|nr:MAG: V-type ATP synthase subunit F [Candidatus Bathyarchaeota archaeon]